MIGAIVGDVVGSRFEWHNIKTKKFELFTEDCSATDDSIMTIAIAEAILSARGNILELPDCAVDSMQDLGRSYPHRGYGGGFRSWINSNYPRPYNSFGNGAAMRISAAGWAAKDVEEAKRLSRAVTAVTHDHPEGIKGAEATAVAIVLAREGKSMREIRDYMEENYYLSPDSVSVLRASYTFNETCQGTMPQALRCFYESESFEDAIRTGISIGGDSDTICAIVGGIAEAYYGVPEKLAEEARRYVPEELLDIVDEFEAKYGSKIIKK